MLLLQVVLSVATVALVWRLGQRVLGETAGRVALALAALYPPLAVKVAYVDPVTLEAFLLVLAALLAAGVGVWAARAAWRRLWPIYALFVSLTAVYSVFFVHTRYRMILEPFLLVLAAHGMAVLWGWIRPYCEFRRCRPPIPGMSSSGLERAD